MNNPRTNAASVPAIDLIEQLQRDHPEESAEQLFNRYEARLAADPALRKSAMAGAFDLLCDQALDDLVREGKEIPAGLKKSN